MNSMLLISGQVVWSAAESDLKAWNANVRRLCGIESAYTDTLIAEWRLALSVAWSDNSQNDVPHQQYGLCQYSFSLCWLVRHPQVLQSGLVAALQAILDGVSMPTIQKSRQLSTKKFFKSTTPLDVFSSAMTQSGLERTRWSMCITLKYVPSLLNIILVLLLTLNCLIEQSCERIKILKAHKTMVKAMVMHKNEIWSFSDDQVSGIRLWNAEVRPFVTLSSHRE